MNINELASKYANTHGGDKFLLAPDLPPMPSPKF